MYGLLAGCQGALHRETRLAWRSHLCGLCESLAQAFGTPARLLATPDAAFLSLLVEAQTPYAPPSLSPSRCPLRRPFYLQVASIKSPGSRFARSIAVAAADARVADAARDHDFAFGWPARIAVAALRPIVARARSDLRTLGFDPSILATAQQATTVAEESPGSFDVLARPVEAAYAAVLGHTATLAGQPGNAEAARELGRWFGRLAYVVDARNDHRSDTARRRFNALAACFGAEARSEAVSLSRTAMKRLSEAAAGLHLARHGGLISQLLSCGLGRKVAWACGRHEGGQRLLRRPKQPEPSGQRTRWRGWGCPAALDEPETDRWCPCCLCGSGCVPDCCLAACLCCS